jgi:hypothetical protein
MSAPPRPKKRPRIQEDVNPPPASATTNHTHSANVQSLTNTTKSNNAAAMPPPAPSPYNNPNLNHSTASSSSSSSSSSNGSMLSPRVDSLHYDVYTQLAELRQENDRLTQKILKLQPKKKRLDTSLHSISDSSNRVVISRRLQRQTSVATDAALQQMQMSAERQTGPIHPLAEHIISKTGRFVFFFESNSTDSISRLHDTANKHEHILFETKTLCFFEIAIDLKITHSFFIFF